MVRVTMDETAVKFWQDGGAGYVQIPGGVKRAEFLETEAKVSLSKKRMVCSLLGFISDDEEMQRLLLQVLVVNERSLLEAATLTQRNASRNQPQAAACNAVEG